MQDPKNEIPAVIATLTVTKSAEDLERTVTRYFTPDAKFFHPMCTASSRNEILGLFEWYRIASPDTKAEVTSVMYDPGLDVLLVEVYQRVHVRFMPFGSAVGRLNVRLQLREVEGLHYIAIEEDLLHPGDAMTFLAPRLLPLANLFLRLGSVVSNLNAGVCRMLGI
ncbi:hypothetical protein HYDPIDRAFT_72686, partial [Hydnomerulius pinastri MD-312]